MASLDRSWEAASESGNGTEGKYRHRAKRRFYYFSNLTPTYVFLFLNFAVRILPYVLNIIVVFLARRLLAAMKEDLYQEESVKLAEKLSHFCVWTLASTIGLGAVFNLLQLFSRAAFIRLSMWWRSRYFPWPLCWQCCCLQSI